MAEKRRHLLRVVRSEQATPSRGQVSREDYWIQLRALRDERDRLRAG